MKRIVLTFGLIGGAVVSSIMSASMLLNTDHDGGSLLIGYASMVLAFLLVYFGIRSYRDNVLDGRIRFGQAFKAGILITLVISSCYVATWEVLFYSVMPDFADRYAASQLQRDRARGVPPAELAKKERELAEFRVNYRKPLYNIGMTYLEILPVGIIMTLVSAGLLSRRRGTAPLTQAAA